MGDLHEDLCTFMIVSPLILLKTRSVLGKSCRENYTVIFSENRTVNDKTWKNIVEAEDATDGNINMAHMLCMLDK